LRRAPPVVGLEEDEEGEGQDDGQGDDEVARLLEGALLPVDPEGQEEDEADLGELGGLEAEPAEEDPAVGLGDAGHRVAEEEQPAARGQQEDDEGAAPVEGGADAEDPDQEADSQSRPQDLLGKEMERLLELVVGQDARRAEDHDDAARDEEQSDDEEPLVEAADPDRFHDQPRSFRSRRSRARTSRLKTRPRSS
jgi:hypothetical protein